MVQCDLRLVAALGLNSDGGFFTGNIMLPDTIDVLEGRVTVLDCTLDEIQKFAYVNALVFGLAELWGDTKRHDFSSYPKNWDKTTDTFLSFLMENFSIELIVYAGVRSFRTHGIDFNSETDVFSEYFERIQKYLV